MTSEAWPRLPVDEWRDTLGTVHLWCQAVGKTRLTLAPGQNHWWNVPLYVNAVGLTTSLMALGARGGLEVVLDFQEHQLVMRLTDGRERRMRLAPRSVSDFYAEYLEKLAELDVEVTLNSLPAEIAGAIPFPEDTVHASYDADAVQQYYRSLVSTHRVLTRFRSDVPGTCSPVHFFWGAFDLAVTRFSGRPAPVLPGGVPHGPDRVMVEAYSHEVSSCGYWPGGADEGVFYAYAHPPPPGFRDHVPASVDAYFDDALGEFVLPYADARRAVDPDAYVMQFVTEIHALASADWPST